MEKGGDLGISGLLFLPRRHIGGLFKDFCSFVDNVLIGVVENFGIFVQRACTRKVSAADEVR